MRLSRTIAYAIDATTRIAREDSMHPIPSSHLAREGELPERFLLQVLRNLVENGILRSTRGVDGGYALARPPNQISILQIVDAFENPLESDLPATHKTEFYSRTRILATLRQASLAARAELQRLTIADLITTVGPESTK
jgi:Rrf2 family protein